VRHEMKKQLIIGLIIIMIASIGCSDKLKQVCNNHEGIYKEYYKNGQIKSELFCKDGELNGISKFYYESGELKSEMNYINGELEGESKSYYKNGVLKSSKNYKNGKLDGLSTWYFESGTFDEFIYFKDGKRPERKIRSVPVPSSFP
jgi:antitoxin component YwqK of YwqJK toxin-antitoxin module